MATNSSYAESNDLDGTAPPGARAVPVLVVLKKDLTWADLQRARRQRSVFRLPGEWNRSAFFNVEHVPVDGPNALQTKVAPVSPAIKPPVSPIARHPSLPIEEPPSSPIL